MIGDSLRDLQAAATAGVARILVRTGHGATTQAAGLPREVLPVAVREDLAAAVDALLGGAR
jgi:D-glycero-D-manno-heptose 1,7-bisphosphate phosphatase